MEENRVIVTVTLNPAVDKTCTAARLLLGQVNRMESVKNIAGGKGINVAKVLRQYGFRVRALGFLGGYTGRFIEECADGLGIECRFTHVSGETRCSTNILSSDGYVTEVLEPGPKISDQEYRQFLQDYEEGIGDADMVILSGSAPEGVPTSIYGELTAAAKRQNKKVLLDTSGSFLKEGAAAVPFMIKPNRKELETLVDGRLKSLEDISDAARILVGRGVSHVLVSMGDKGLLYVTPEEALYAKAPKIKAVNTVGCGDSVVAAFAMANKSGMSRQELLKYCVGISAANASTLESAVIPMDKAQELMENVTVVQL